MKYDIENLNDVKRANDEIKNLCEDLNDLLNRAINVKQDLDEVEQILATPKKDVTHILRHSEMIKEFGTVFCDQLATVKEMNKLINKIYISLQSDYDATVKTIKT